MERPPFPNHVAIIPDGNRRWGKKNNVDESEAYLQGAKRMIEVVEGCLEDKIAHLSVFGLSRDNLKKRSLIEVVAIHKAVVSCCREALKKDVAIQFFGDFQQLVTRLGSDDLLQVSSPRAGSRLVFRIGVNYSGTDDWTPNIPKVDLLIRTGGQQRLSNFLPMQNADAELLFLPVLWPDFSKTNWMNALSWYATQDRREGE